MHPDFVQGRLCAKQLMIIVIQACEGRAIRQGPRGPPQGQQFLEYQTIAEKCLSMAPRLENECG